MADLFVALGYDQPRINIHKSGREVDLSANHRLEARRAIAECKATNVPIGGGPLNKFVGVLDVEHDDKGPISGYFISLSGFTESALEQEIQRRTKLITLTGTQVVTELIHGRIIVSAERATELAGRCCAHIQDVVLDGSPELVAHDRGWVWIVSYTKGKDLNAFVLVHADGTPLASTLANIIVESDRACGGSLHARRCLNPISAALGTVDEQSVALAAYGRYLSEECGFIHLDGLPPDGDVGSRRFMLESLFVPLHLDIPSQNLARVKVGPALAHHPRLALLAAPGGGKSTLAKRLAVAYSVPARRDSAADQLPDRNWMPLFFRCRELRHMARASFGELIQVLSEREPVRQHAAAFRAIVDRALVDGRALLLVDGLDEISDAGDRASFVCTIRTALQAYPNVSLVVTSREAGFRHVAAHLAPICVTATLSSFDAADIKQLVLGWHIEVVGNTERVRQDAETLALSIMRSDRILLLAENPLLLTTLLLVRRWVGSLPTRRSVLYGRAVEVLLMTWNPEGHHPIGEDEALPQLCYVASSMMMEGSERISRRRLAALLREARVELPTELGYVKESVQQFINRIEDRCSLLMMVGHEVENGQLVESFEFSHLTFQEFLTARGMVEGWHSGRRDNDTLATTLQPYFNEDKWREVVPLAASLGGKATEGLIKLLSQHVDAMDKASRDNGNDKIAVDMLGRCLADEAAARPDTVRCALRALVSVGLTTERNTFAPVLARGKYGAELRNEAARAFVENDLKTVLLTTLQSIVWWQSFDIAEEDWPLHVAHQCATMIRSKEYITRCEGALGCVALTERRGALLLSLPQWQPLGDACVPLLFASDEKENYCAALALLKLSERGWIPLHTPDALGQMFKLWQHASAKAVRNIMSSALAAQMVMPHTAGPYFATVDVSEVRSVLGTALVLDRDSQRVSALVAAWYARVCSDEELYKLALQTESRALALAGLMDQLEGN